MPASLSFHANPLTLRRLMPHNGGMVLFADSNAAAGANEVAIFARSVETCARLALATPEWHRSLELYVMEASRTDPMRRAERVITDHGEIRAWLTDALHEAEAAVAA